MPFSILVFNLPSAKINDVEQFGEDIDDNITFDDFDGDDDEIDDVSTCSRAYVHIYAYPHMGPADINV